MNSQGNIFLQIAASRVEESELKKRLAQHKARRFVSMVTEKTRHMTNLMIVNRTGAKSPGKISMIF